MIARHRTSRGHPKQTRKLASELVGARSTAPAVCGAKRGEHARRRPTCVSAALAEAPSPADTDGDGRDELVELSKDNERLKRPWRTRLIWGNTWLRDMLDRFDDGISRRSKLRAPAWHARERIIQCLRTALGPVERRRRRRQQASGQARGDLTVRRRHPGSGRAPSQPLRKRMAMTLLERCFDRQFAHLVEMPM
jgi:hypothetical protein